MNERKSFKEWLGVTSDLVKTKLMDVAEWCKEHKETIIVFGPVIISGAIEFARASAKRNTVKEERALKERFIYDRSAGHYYELRRKPKDREWLRIDQRRDNGESMGSILNDMGLLK